MPITKMASSCRCSAQCNAFVVAAGTSRMAILLTEFKRFPELCAELRLWIWELSTQRRIIKLKTGYHIVDAPWRPISESPNGPKLHANVTITDRKSLDLGTLLACKESREVAIRAFKNYLHLGRSTN